jgi:hypothetical protein
MVYGEYQNILVDNTQTPMQGGTRTARVIRVRGSNVRYLHIEEERREVQCPVYRVVCILITSEGPLGTHVRVEFRVIRIDV